jgi:hypothetical protein
LNPNFSKVARRSIEVLQKEKTLYTIYNKRFDAATLDYSLAHQYNGNPNESPAPRASFFQRVTAVLFRLAFLSR